VPGPVVFTALQDRIWVKFYDGAGKQLVQKLLAKGETWTVPDDAVDPKLWTGRPDALGITIGGQAVPRIADKQGIVKDVPVSAAALLARPAPGGRRLLHLLPLLPLPVAMANTPARAPGFTACRIARHRPLSRSRLARPTARRHPPRRRFSKAGSASAAMGAMIAGR
jgi:hypothetical protein